MHGLSHSVVSNSCYSMDGSLRGFSVHGIHQARILDWVAMPSSRGSSQPRDKTLVSCIFCTGRWILYHCATCEAYELGGQCIRSGLLNFINLSLFCSCLVFLKYLQPKGPPQNIRALTGQCKSCKRCGFDPWVGKIPCKRKWQTTPVFFLGKSHGQRLLTGYRLWGHKESDTAEHIHTYINRAKSSTISF